MNNDILNSVIRGAREVLTTSTSAARKALANADANPGKAFKLTAVATGSTATLLYIGACLEVDGHCKLEDFLRQCGEEERIISGAREQMAGVFAQFQKQSERTS